MIKHINKPVIQTNNVQIETMPNGYVQNPETGKLIKVGGKSYNKLLQNGTVNAVVVPPTPKAKNPNIIAECKNSVLAKGMKTKLQQEQPLQNNQVYAITNDQKRVMVRQKKSKSMKIPDMTDLVSKAVSRVHKKLSGGEYEDNEETTQYFKQLIEQELIMMGKKHPAQQDPENDDTDSDDESDIE